MGKGPSTEEAHERSQAGLPWILTAFLLFGTTLALRFPGVAMYDSVAQYEQAVAGDLLGRDATPGLLGCWRGYLRHRLAPVSASASVSASVLIRCW